MNVNKNEAYDREAMNPDAYPYVTELVDNFYGPIYKKIKDGKFEEAKAEIDELDLDLKDFIATNSKRRFFRFPQFMVDAQKKQMQALHRAYDRAVATAEDTQLAVAESYDKEGKAEKCEFCGTLLNDMGTCPKCDDGEEDYGDLDEAIHHNISGLSDEIEEEIYHYVMDEFRGNAPSSSFDKLLAELADVEFDADAARKYYDELVDEYTSNTDSLEAELELLQESLLTEGPKLRALGRKIANKFDPAGARDREVGGHNKDENSHRAKQAPKICAQDFTTKAQHYKFYPNKEDSQEMTYDEWRHTYGSVTPADENTYAEWYNAIVTDEHGMYVRRGSEDMHRSTTFIPEKNDLIPEMYRIAPYVMPYDQAISPISRKRIDKYIKGEDKKEAPAEETPAEDKSKEAQAVEPIPKKEESVEEPKTSASEEDKSKKPPREKKPTVAVGDKDLARFYRLCNLTSLRVYDKAGKELKLPEIKELVKADNLADFKVNNSYGTMSSLAVWFQKAIKARFLDKIQEYLEYNFGDTLNENVLTESPLQLSNDQLLDPDKIDVHQLIKDSQLRDEEAELAKNEATAIEIIERGEDLVVMLDDLNDLLVPNEGKAPSVAGERIRAISRIHYRLRNDGDMFFTGYGIETCGGPAMYLYNEGYDQEIDSILDAADRYLIAGDVGEEEYESEIYDLAAQIVTDIHENPQFVSTKNNVDSYNCKTTYLKENQPRFDFDVYVPHEVTHLVENGLVTVEDVYDYVRSSLRDNGIKEFEIERPWSRHTIEVLNICELSGSDYDTVANELFADDESFWEGFVNEHSVDDISEEELDECVSSLRESVDYGCLLTGADVIDGISGNMTNKEFDRTLKTLSHIARKLKVKRADDVICYVDNEWIYDPTLVNNEHWQVPMEVTFYTVNGIDLATEIVNGNLWLYFNNEKDCRDYLEYIDNYF